jgi:hypothetical protein
LAPQRAAGAAAKAEVSMSNKSFDQAGVNTSEMRQAKAKYDAAVKSLVGVSPDDEKYPDYRKAKFEAAVAMSKAREAAEQSFYAETIQEVKADAEAIKKANEEQAKVSTN